MDSTKVFAISGYVGDRNSEIPSRGRYAKHLRESEGLPIYLCTKRAAIEEAIRKTTSDGKIYGIFECELTDAEIDRIDDSNASRSPRRQGKVYPAPAMSRLIGYVRFNGERDADGMMGEFILPSYPDIQTDNSWRDGAA
jgi:hypothetical protein